MSQSQQPKTDVEREELLAQRIESMISIRNMKQEAKLPFQAVLYAGDPARIIEYRNLTVYFMVVWVVLFVVLIVADADAGWYLAAFALFFLGGGLLTIVFLRADKSYQRYLVSVDENGRVRESSLPKIVPEGGWGELPSFFKSINRRMPDTGTWRFRMNVPEDSDEHLGRIRSNTAYPTYRAVLGFFFGLGYLPAGGLLIVSVIAVFLQDGWGGRLLAIGGIVLAILFGAVLDFFKEKALMTPDIADAHVHLSASMEAAFSNMQVAMENLERTVSRVEASVSNMERARSNVEDSKSESKSDNDADTD